MAGVAELVDQASKLSDDEKNEFVLGIVEKMSVLNLSTLVKKVEEKFDVKASGGGGFFVPPPTTEAKQAEVEKTEFVVFLKDAGAKKLGIIKDVRTITNLGLKEAKELVDKAPTVLKTGLTKDAAEKAKKLLEDGGATVELQ